MGIKNNIVKKSAAAMLAINMLCCGPIANISMATQINTCNDMALIATQVLRGMTVTVKPKMDAETIAADINNNNNAGDYYGKKVSGYTVNNQSNLSKKYDWQIFYIGKNPNLSDSDPDNKSHIYLTTTDYIDLSDWALQSDGSSLFINNETGSTVEIGSIILGGRSTD